MKKVLEDELMSLAHRILKMRNRAEIHELKEESAVLYEKLSVLSFAEKHFDGLRPTIKKHDVEASIKKDFKEKEGLNYPDGTEYNEDQIYEHNTEKIKDIVSQMPYESGQVDEMFEEKKGTSAPEPPSKPKEENEDDVQDFGVHFDDLPDFEPASDDKTDEKEDSSQSKEEESNNKEEDKADQDLEKPRTKDLFSQQKKSLNDSLNKDFKIGLNDRLSFVNHLFEGDTEAYNNFINHINGLNSFNAVKSYVDELLNSKFSFWKEKEEVMNRLLYIIEKKFE